MRTRIKICCMASLEEAQLAIGAGADAVGFVGRPPSSPRAIDDRTIAAIATRVPPPIATFLLTAESTAAGVARHVCATGVSAVQIITHLDPSESEQLPKLLPTTQRVQVIHVENRSALDLIDPYAPHVHAFLLDSGRPSLPTPQYGGTGRTHDWSVSAEFVRRSPLPVFLAGGLSPGNVGEAMRTVRPFGVDLCSGVRTEGHLDRKKLGAFVKAVRTADTEGMTHPRRLHTPRLVLEPFVLGDADDLYSIRGDSLAMECWDWPGDTAVEQTRAVARTFIEDMKRGAALYWTVRSQPNREFVGIVDLSDRSWDRADLGFMIRRDLWGRGYASEVAAAVIDEAWAAGLTRLTARCHAENTRSVRLLMRLRFRETSTRPIEIRPGVIRQNRFFELQRGA